jgi:mlo protein
MASLNQVTVAASNEPVVLLQNSSDDSHGEYSFRVEEYLSDSLRVSVSLPPTNGEEEEDQGKVETLFNLFQKT